MMNNPVEISSKSAARCVNHSLTCHSPVSSLKYRVVALKSIVMTYVHPQDSIRLAVASQLSAYGILMSCTANVDNPSMASDSVQDQTRAPAKPMPIVFGRTLVVG